MGPTGSCDIAIRTPDEKLDIEFDRDAVRVRQRVEFDFANQKGTARIIDAVLSEVVSNERLILRAVSVVLNCLIEVSHHFSKIISLEIPIERPDKTFGFRLSDRSRRGSTECGRSESDAPHDDNCEENFDQFLKALIILS
jgi:hypothetical protein